MITIAHDRDYGLSDVIAVADGAQVALAPSTIALLKERRAQIVAVVEETQSPAYGFNRGFGHNVDVPVPPHRLSELQENLIRSHAAGVGEPAPPRVVRAVMFLRAVSLARGHSGVRPEIITALAEMLNRGVIPVVPRHGSVGASGDLAPLSHIVLVMLGEGQAWVGDGAEPVAGDQALAQVGMEPIRLAMKEGLALNNGVQFSTALGILAWERLETLLATATINTALAVQVMLGSDAPFLAELHALRPHPGARAVAADVAALLRDSPIRAAHERYDVDGEVQDPYNLRCAAQVLGTCRELLDEARQTFEIEINSVTDNPILLEDAEHPGAFTRIVSGGHFHGMPVAIRLYGLVEAMGVMARLSNMRCARYVDESRNKGLGSDLKWPGLSDEEAAVSSSMMIPEYVSAALTNTIWGAAMPTHLFSLSTDAGQEDHVSMSAGLAVRLWESIPRLSEALAIELAFASQAAAVRRSMVYFPSKKKLLDTEMEALEDARSGYEAAVRGALDREDFDIELDVRVRYRWNESERRLSPACERVLEVVGEAFSAVERDRTLTLEFSELAARVERGDIVAAARELLSPEGS